MGKTDSKDTEKITIEKELTDSKNGVTMPENRARVKSQPQILAKQKLKSGKFCKIPRPHGHNVLSNAMKHISVPYPTPGLEGAGLHLLSAQEAY